MPKKKSSANIPPKIEPTIIPAFGPLFRCEPEPVSVGLGVEVTTIVGTRDAVTDEVGRELEDRVEEEMAVAFVSTRK
jgi:hypothetical protein